MDLKFMEFLEQKSPFFHSSIHGIRHWKTVERNGLYLSKFTGADRSVISYFAYLHDCMRQNDHIDPDHGLRGAKFAQEHRSIIDLDDDQFEKLYFACENHTEGESTACETINTCLDADRLDIGRVGFIVDSFYLSSTEAKRISEEKDFQVLESKN
tara:strand:- start:899 stop:1363 length:465 start_codon:yes stop_codon:yes gene_type:complete